MDSPRISNREAWGLILKVAAINIVLTPVIFAVGFSIFGGNLNEITNYKNYHQAFILPWNKFHVFLSDDNLKVALTEEFLYRFPALLLMHVLVLTGHKVKKYDFEWLTVIALSLILNYHWAYDHIGIYIKEGEQIVKHTYYFIFPPVFLTGLTWIWLNMRIRPTWPWPSIVVHLLANTSIYLFLKIIF